MIQDSDALRALEGHREPGDAIYSLTRRERRPLWRAFLDVVVTGGLINDGQDLAANLSAPFYLIATEDDATIVRVRDGHVVDTLRVDTWKPSDKERFRSININSHNYRKVARIA